MNLSHLIKIFFCKFQGFTKSLLEKSRDISSSYPTQSQMASAVGYVLGFLIGKKCQQDTKIRMNDTTDDLLRTLLQVGFSCRNSAVCSSSCCPPWCWGSLSSLCRGQLLLGRWTLSTHSLELLWLSSWRVSNTTTYKQASETFVINSSLLLSFSTIEAVM